MLFNVTYTISSWKYKIRLRQTKFEEPPERDQDPLIAFEPYLAAKELVLAQLIMQVN